MFTGVFNVTNLVHLKQQFSYLNLSGSLGSILFPLTVVIMTLLFSVTSLLGFVVPEFPSMSSITVFSSIVQFWKSICSFGQHGEVEISNVKF